MAVYTNINTLPSFRKAVLTVGTFDGVHSGHYTILSEVTRQARLTSGESILITFHPHPRQLLYPDEPLGIITPLEDKIDLLLATGLDHIVVVPFTSGFAQLTANEYINRFLVQTFHPEAIVIGYDHKFGADRKGDIEMLKQYAPSAGYRIVEIPASLIDEAAISSTRIRTALLRGGVAEANQMLGRPYSLRGRVVHGRQLGRTIGYPTANLEPVDATQIVPAIGVYAVNVKINDMQYGGMLSIGYNPTVTTTRDIKIEVNIFDFNADIYDASIAVDFLQRIRDEKHFDSLEALVAAIDNDKKAALAIIAQS